jgi:hypothetical protein
MGSLLLFLLQVVFGAWFMASQPKTKFVIIFWERQDIYYFSRGRARGPDWARTSDPALIKRML